MNAETETARPDRHATRAEIDGDNNGRAYRIVRMYFRGGRRTIATGLTLNEAQAHCSNPETSSSTATGAAARRITSRNGAWFDGYELDTARRR